MVTQQTERPRAGMTPVEVPILVAGVVAVVIALGRLTQGALGLALVLGVAAVLLSSALLARTVRG